jgi:SAM-dependent methyltransferase
MSELKHNAKSWDTAWSNEGSQSWYPDEQIVRFLAGQFVQRVGPSGTLFNHKRDNTNLVGVDFGCGKGRHIVTMREHGIEGFGIDLSEVGVKQANQWLDHLNFPKTATAGSLTDMPYDNNQFDLGICHGVLDHMTSSIRAASLSEIQRTLKPGAKLLLSLISENDSALGEGEEIEYKTWLITDGYEKDLPQAFFDQARIQNELKHFNIIAVTEVLNQTHKGRSLIGTDKHYACDARYYITAESR